jgi:hypothetical protein
MKTFSQFRCCFSPEFFSNFNLMISQLSVDCENVKKQNVADFKISLFSEIVMLIKIRKYVQHP